MPAIVQSASFSTPSGGFVSTATVNFGAAPTLGNILFAVCAWDKNTAGSITLPTGFTEIDTQHNGGPSVDLALAYKVSDGTETSFTSTVPASGVCTSGLTVFEISGLVASGLVDAASIQYFDDLNVNSRATPTLDSTTALTYALAIFLSDTVVSGRLIDGVRTWTNGFSEVFITPTSSNAGQVGFSMAAKSLSAITTGITSTLSYTGSADQAMSALVLFKAAAPPVNAVKHGLSHPATPTSAVFKFELTSAATDAFVQVLDYTTLSVVASSTPAAIDSEKIGGATITGLTPDTRYKWRVATTSNGQDTGFTGEFYTAWTAGATKTYELCFGSDNQINSADFTTYTRIAAINPRFFLSVGDHPYIDVSTNDPTTFRSKYRTLLQNATWRTLADKTPYAYIYDDHDFSGNDSDSTGGAAALAATEFRRFYPVPSFPMSAVQAHSFVVGRIRHIMMDLRAERIIGTRIMSPTQLQWVKDELTAAKNARQVVVLHSSSPVLDTNTANTDSWGAYFVTRTAIMDHAKTLGMQSSGVWHHADAHMLAWDDGTNTKFDTGATFGWPLFCAAAITQGGSVKGGPYSGGSLAGQHQFARLTITETAGSDDVSVRVRLVKGDDSNFSDQTITLTAVNIAQCTFTDHPARSINNGALPDPVAAASITFAPAGGVAATNVQTAIVELDAEKAALVHSHVVGDISGLGGAATKNVGTTTGTVAAGDDSRIVAGGTALQPAVIGSTVQAYSAKLAAIAALTWAADTLIYLTGTSAAAVTALTSYARTLLAAATMFEARVLVGVGTPSKIAEIYEDFLGASAGSLGARVAGTGASITFALSFTGRDGIARLSAGTSSSGYAFIGGLATGSATARMVMGEGLTTFETAISIPTLSTGTETFTVRAGFQQNAITEPVSGLYFRYTDGVNSGKVECVARTGDVETAVDSGVTVNADDWLRCQVRVNAAGTSVGFYIGVNRATPTLCATITTNIPTTSTNPVGPMVRIDKTAGAGATSSLLYADWVYGRKEYTTER